MGNTTQIEQALERFKAAQEQMMAMNYATSILFWDASTGAPKSGADKRSTSIGTMSGFMYKLLVNETMDADLNLLTNHLDALSDVDRVRVVDTKKEYDKLTKIPMEAYQKYSALTSKASMIWEEAKENADFKLFEPYLEEIVSYLLKFAEYRGYQNHPYNLYIDDFEEGMTIDQLNTFFDTLRARIVPLLEKIQASGKQVATDFLGQAFPVDKQHTVSTDLLKTIGFDLNRGWFKESVHPFTMGLDVNDVRLTTHYYENDLKSALLSSAHEGGHAIYEQNFSEKVQGTPLATGTSNGFHESQSRIYENNFVLSRSFLSYFLLKLKADFPEQLGSIGDLAFYEGMNKVEPSLIRIEADELTYSLHIMIRYEIELGLFDGSIKVSDLPRVWNEKVKAYLGITPKHDGEGVLQDVHWSEGMFGYFPTYALGSAYAAQLMHYMKQDLDVDTCLKNGDFKPLTAWLNDKVHQYGSLVKPVDLMKQITGEAFNATYYCDYLEQKYSELYGLK
ncbi:carboxypeptidase M32 [Fusibacter tunisiensis]|uniref:Metal-dependent carboxypeptidase n=1 Tax=Fusibacter tunisiensis TaxID=1008308 RepID=A0ABS2MS29_9FIRM|nr:carboxypeptidase M32 [Fusibacter tunisiensis]MBM7562228.1 carboxypeptidase Taq [Fusibacter tunisiensis]